MNKTLDFITSALFGGGISYGIGYVWFLLSDMNALNAIFMLAGISWVAIGALTALVAGVVWAFRHVRITIV